MKLKTTLALGVALAVLALPALAQDYGKFDGYTQPVKLIGGAQYEPLYAEIPKWEAATGAKVEIVSSKNHFELDKEIKQDIAAGTLDWCVGSNHTSFAPQYGEIYTHLTPLIAAEDIADFVPLMIQHSTVDGRLVQLPRHSGVSNFFYQQSLYEDAEKQAACVTDGGLGDTNFILRLGFPCWGVFHTPRDVVGCWLPTATDLPILIDDVLVRPGDWLHGDRDGMVCIPAEILAEVAGKAEAAMATESLVRRAILAGLDPQDAYLKHGKF